MNPRIFERELGGGYAVEVDLRRDDCKREPPHAHLTFRGRRVGQIWVETATFERIPYDVPNHIINDAIEIVEDNRWDIIEIYNYNKTYGAG